MAKEFGETVELSTIRISEDTRVPSVVVSGIPQGGASCGHEAFKSNLAYNPEGILFGSSVEFNQNGNLSLRPTPSKEVRDFFREVLLEEPDPELRQSAVVQNIYGSMPYIEFGNRQEGITFYVPGEASVQRINDQTISYDGETVKDLSFVLEVKDKASISPYVEVDDKSETSYSKMRYALDLELPDIIRKILGDRVITASFKIINLSSDRIFDIIEKAKQASGPFYSDVLFRSLANITLEMYNALDEEQVA